MREKDVETNYRTPDDEHEMRPLWEIARGDRKDDLKRRRETGEDVDSEIATENLFEGIADVMGRE